MAALFFAGEPISPIAPGVAWLLLAPLCLEAHYGIGNFSPAKWNQNGSEGLLHVSYVLIAAFVVRHIFYHLQVEEHWGIFKVRLLIELLGLSVLAYFLLAPSPKHPSPSWRLCHPYTLEALLLAAIGTIAVEVPYRFTPLAWGLGAIALFPIGSAAGERFSRLRSYTLALAWAGAIHVAAIASTISTPDAHWYFQPSFAGIVTLLLSVSYLTIIRTSDFFLSDSFPQGFGPIEKVVRAIASRRHLVLYYPFFLSMAVFIFWQFESALLTLAFVVLSFVIFTVSILHSVPHFRILSLSLLGLCIGRLVIFDLAQSGTLARGIVFLGVGGIMVLMNVIYRRFYEVA